MAYGVQPSKSKWVGLSAIVTHFPFLRRCSMFYISRMDGVLDAWDLLQQHNEPVLSIKVCDEPLMCMRAHESGSFISAGSANGTTFLIEVSDNMATSLKNDKPLLTAMFERENKREKILEAKLREMKLKVKTAQLQHDENDSKTTKATAIEEACQQAEQEYMKAVQKEKTKLCPKSIKREKKRHDKNVGPDMDDNDEENDVGGGDDDTDNEYDVDGNVSYASE